MWALISSVFLYSPSIYLLTVLGQVEECWSKGLPQNLQGLQEKEVIETIWDEANSGINLRHELTHRKPVLTHIWSGWRGSSMVNRKKGKWANTYAAAVNLLLCWSQVPVHKLYRNTVNTSVPSERKSDEGDITNTLWFQFCTPVCSHVNTPFPWRFCRRKQTCRLYYLHLWKPGLWCRVLGMWWMCFQEIVNKLKRCVIPESCVSVTCFLSVWEVCVIMSVILTAVSSCTHMPSQLLLFVCFGCNSETKVLCHTSVWNDI